MNNEGQAEAMTPEQKDHYVGLMHVACRRLRSGIELLDKDVPEKGTTEQCLLDAQRIVNELVEELCGD